MKYFIIQNIFFLLITITKYINTLIVLPIYTGSSYEEEDLEFPTKELRKYNLKKILTTKIFTNISMGNPKQEIKTLITFQSPLLFIAGNGTFNHENSSTFNINENPPRVIKMKIQDYLYTYSYFCSDNFFFKNLNNEYKNYTLNFHIGYASDEDWTLSDKNYIGLSPEKFEHDNEIIALSFIAQLKKKGIIFSNTFTFDFDKSNKEMGKIIIGNYPHEYDTKKYNVNDFRVFGLLNNDNQRSKWILTFNFFSIRNFTYEDDNMNQNIIFEHEGTYNFIINYELNFISLDSELSIHLSSLIENVYENLCTKAIIKYRSSEKFTYVCNETINIKKFPSLYFSLKPIDHMFELDYTDLFEKKNNTYFLLIVFSYNQATREIGLPFLRKYNLVFQENEQVVGYYLNKNHGEKLSLFVSILLISICINILFIIFFVRRYYKRKNMKKIDYTYFDDKEKQIGGLDNIDSESLDS